MDDDDDDDDQMSSLLFDLDGICSDVGPRKDCCSAQSYVVQLQHQNRATLQQRVVTFRIKSQQKCYTLYVPFEMYVRSLGTLVYSKVTLRFHIDSQ